MIHEFLPNEIFVQQEIFFITGKPRVFTILDTNKNILFDLTENKQYNFWQLIFQSKKPFNMEVLFNDRKFKFVKRSKLLSDILGIFNEDENLIALVKKNFLKDIEIFDENEKKIFDIKGSLIKKDFKIKKNYKEVGIITKKFSGVLKEMFSDSDNFYIKFPDKITLEEQMVFVATSIFIDSIYFDE
jgi:hypothetical protein